MLGRWIFILTWSLFQGTCYIISLPENLPRIPSNGFDPTCRRRRHRRARLLSHPLQGRQGGHRLCRGWRTKANLGIGDTTPGDGGCFFVCRVSCLVFWIYRGWLSHNPHVACLSLTRLIGLSNLKCFKGKGSQGDVPVCPFQVWKRGQIFYNCLHLNL